MVQSLHHSSGLSLQRIQDHSADFLEPLQSRQCILVTGSMLVSPLSGTVRPRASYMTTLLKDIVEWCASKEIITQPARVEKWRALVEENELPQLVYSIGEYLPDKSDLQRCLSDILFDSTPIPGFDQFLASYTFRGYITTAYDTFIEKAYYAQWQRPLTKLRPASLSGWCPASALEQPFIFKPYGDKDTLDLASLRQRIRGKVLTREEQEQFQQLVAGSPMLFLGFESTDPEFQMLRDLIGHRDLFFSSFPLREEPRASTDLLARRIVVSNQFPEEAAPINVQSGSFSNALHLPQMQTDSLPSKDAPKLEIFLSFVASDKKSKNELSKILSVLQRQYKNKHNININVNDKDTIGVGHEWKQVTQRYLSEAHIILLLVSLDFLYSEFCMEVELTQAIDRHRAKKARVIPIILESCPYHNEEFSCLKLLPEEGKPVNEWTPRSRAFSNIAAGIEQAIKELALMKPNKE